MLFAVLLLLLLDRDAAWNDEKKRGREEIIKNTETFLFWRGLLPFTRHFVTFINRLFFSSFSFSFCILTFSDSIIIFFYFFIRLLRSKVCNWKKIKLNELLRYIVLFRANNFNSLSLFLRSPIVLFCSISTFNSNWADKTV